MAQLLTDGTLQELAALVEITEQSAAAMESSDLLNAWYTFSKAWQSLQKIRDAELTLRKIVAGRFFAQPKEGTNRFSLEGGFDLKLVQNFDRKPDETIPQAFSRMREMGVDVDRIFPLVPTIRVSEYKEFVSKNTVDGKPNERLLFVDSFIVTKPSSPQVEIVRAKRT